MLSSGLTDLGILDALKVYGYHVVGVGSLYERGDGLKNIQEAGYNAKGLARLEVIGEKPDWKPEVPYFWDSK